MLAVGLQARVSRTPSLRSARRVFADGERQRDEPGSEENSATDKRESGTDQILHASRPQEREAEEHSEQTGREREAGDDADGSADSGFAHESSTGTANERPLSRDGPRLAMGTSGRIRRRPDELKTLTPVVGLQRLVTRHREPRPHETPARRGPRRSALEGAGTRP